MNRPVRRPLSGTIILVALAMPPQGAAAWERGMPVVVYAEARRRRRPARRFDGKWTLVL